MPRHVTSSKHSISDSGRRSRGIRDQTSPSLNRTGGGSRVLAWDGMYSLAGVLLGEVPAAHHTWHRTCHPNRAYCTGVVQHTQ